MVRLLACKNPCGWTPENGCAEEPLRAFEDERGEERAIVRAYILDPARVVQVRKCSLCLFGHMATWCGTRYTTPLALIANYPLS